MHHPRVKVRRDLRGVLHAAPRVRPIPGARGAAEPLGLGLNRLLGGVRQVHGKGPGEISIIKKDSPESDCFISFGSFRNFGNLISYCNFSASGEKESSERFNHLLDSSTTSVCTLQSRFNFKPLQLWWTNYIGRNAGNHNKYRVSIKTYPPFTGG